MSAVPSHVKIEQRRREAAVDRLPLRDHSSSNGDHAVKLSIEDFREALDIVGDCAVQQAAIVAQFVLDLAVTAQFRADGARRTR